jgi:hypothetical protein
VELIPHPYRLERGLGLRDKEGEFWEGEPVERGRGEEEGGGMGTMGEIQP